MSCRLCGGSQSEIVATAGQMRFGCFGANKSFRKCLLCGLVYLSPPWTAKELEKLYATYWSVADFKGQKRKVKVSRYLGKMVSRGDAVLEVGSGYGDNLDYLNGLGIDAKGIDKSPEVCDGARVINADFAKYRPRVKPDFIFAIHLFEHLPNPQAFIRWMIRTLSERGRFCLEIPCVDDPLRTLYRNKGYEPFGWYPYHLFYFSAKTARYLFDQFPGLKVRVEVKQEYGLLNHMRWIILRRPGNALPEIPIIDSLYKWFLTKIIGVGDTLLITGEKI